MALNFELKLSFQSCQLLIACLAMQDHLEKIADFSKAKRLEVFSDFMPDFSHFISHGSVLRRHGLITTVDTNNHFVTEKGKLLAQLLELEFGEAMKFKEEIGRAFSRQLKAKGEKDILN